MATQRHESSEFQDLAAAALRMERLERAETAELHRRARRGDRAAATRLVEVSLRRVVRAVNRQRHADVEPMELFEAGTAGLWRAVETDVHGRDFQSHVDAWVREAMQPLLDEGTGKQLRALAKLLHGREPKPAPAGHAPQWMQRA